MYTHNLLAILTFYVLVFILNVNFFQNTGTLEGDWYVLLVIDTWSGLGPQWMSLIKAKCAETLVLKCPYWSLLVKVVNEAPMFRLSEAPLQ